LIQGIVLPRNAQALLQARRLDQVASSHLASTKGKEA
jgi:hypothetical protein